MKSLFLAVLVVFFLVGALTGHAVIAADGGVGSYAGGASSGHHRGDPVDRGDGGSTLGFHCTVSASCVSVFMLAGLTLVDHSIPTAARWRIDVDDIRRPRVPDRDPPVPRG